EVAPGFPSATRLWPQTGESRSTRQWPRSAAPVLLRDPLLSIPRSRRAVCQNFAGAFLLWVRSAGQTVAELVALGRQIVGVVRIDRGEDRNLIDDVQVKTAID